MTGNMTTTNSTFTFIFINSSINMSGNLSSNASITFAASNLTINSTVQVVNGIYLTAANFSIINGSLLTSNNTNAGFDVSIDRNSTMYVNESVVEYVANGTNHGFVSEGNLTIFNSTFSKSVTNAYALIVNNGTTTVSRGAFMTNFNGILVNQSTFTITNSNITGTTGSYSFASWKQNVTFNNTSVVNVTSFLNNTNITMSWPVRFTINNSYSTPNTTFYPLVGSATILITSSSDSGFDNQTLTTDVNGTTSVIYLNEYVKNGSLPSANVTFAAYTLNVSSSLGNFSACTINVSMAMDGAIDGVNRGNCSVYEVFNNVSLAKMATSATAPPGSFANVTLTIENVGNGGNPINWSQINLSSNASGTWSISFTNTSANLTNGSTQVINARINVPGTARPSTAYIFNISASIGGRVGQARSDSFLYTLTTNNTTALANFGHSVQNASHWLIQNSTNGSFWGENSTYSTAWGLWAFNLSDNTNSTTAQPIIINKTLEWLNTTNSTNSKEANEYWVDATGEEGNQTTALILLALMNGGFSDTPNAENHYLNLTTTIEYLQNQTNETSEAYICWGNASANCDAYNTSIMLSALWKTDNKNLTIVNNATNWLLFNQSLDGSWNQNLTHTAWAIYALQAASNNSVNLTRAVTWLENKQNIDGSFGNPKNIHDTGLALLALNAAGNATWTVDVDQNTTRSTSDQYPGSIKYALDFILRDQEENGGWGFSPANAKGAALGALAVGNYGTLKGNISGSGAAVRYGRISNVTVNLTSSGGTVYSALTNVEGEYIINAPAASGYTLTTNHSLFEINNTNSSVTITTGTNLTQNLDMLPELIVTGNFGANGFFDPIGPSSGNTYAIEGYVNYTYNLSQAFSGNYTIQSSPNGVTKAKTGFISNDFSTGNLEAPSADIYAVYVFVEDDNGSSYNSSQSFTVGGTDEEETPVTNSGSPGGSTPTDYSMSVTSYDSQVSVIQGESSSTSFTIKNNGAKALEDVKLEVIGIPSSWYTAKVKSTGLSTEDLASSESVTFDITFNPPSDAEPKSYTITLKVKDSDGLAIAEKKVTFKVTKVWDTVKISTLNTQIETIKEDLATAKADVKVLDAKGYTTTEMDADLEAFSTALQNAITKYNAGDYTESERYYKEAQVLLEKIQNAVASATAPESKIATWLSGLSLGIVSIAIIIILIGGFVGFILWYKMFRVIPISEVKKDPDLFVEGARIEGVVKSITETKKGKVFLVQDQKNKLHVRYPFYTTIETGNLIRAVGNVKTYKGVPYMDASDVHRVTVKHFGNFMKKKGGHGFKNPASAFLKRFKR
jgi:hypothetical protein